jgi:hypothetical protein
MEILLKIIFHDKLAKKLYEWRLKFPKQKKQAILMEKKSPK